MNFILWKEKYILGRIGLYVGGFLGEADIILRIWGAKEKYFQGAEAFSFRDLKRSMHCFQGSREHRPPGGLTICFSGRGNVRGPKVVTLMHLSDCPM